MKFKQQRIYHLSIFNCFLFASTLCCLLFGAGCKTPPEVKQALVSMDQGYADNVKLMRGYQQVYQGFKERHRCWSLYVKQHTKLDLALRWATTEPQPPGVSKERYADVSRDILGPNVVALVNRYRLKALAPCSGPDGSEIFSRGTNTIDALVQALPALVNAITTQSTAEYDATVKNDTSAFDDYAAKVAALERINEAIERYLSIDVTAKPEDVKNIAGSIQSLSGK
jgi:hypothetical protein